MAVVESKPRVPFEASEFVSSGTSGIDRIVLQTTGSRLGMSRACSDAVFVRRAFFDAIGTLPTFEEVREFLRDRAPAKRHRLIEQLLNRSEFADYWSMRWCERLRVKSEFPINLWPNAAQAYHRWIHAAIRDRMPYDRFVRELLTSSGSNFRMPAVNFYRALATRTPRGWAQAVALTFLCERSEKWPVEKWDGFAAFFTQLRMKGTQEWKEEILYHDWTTLAPAHCVFPDGSAARLDGTSDPREALAQWLTTGAGSLRLAEAIANRIWAWLMGRGIVHEPDDISPDNPPVSPELLSFLARHLINARWDLRSLVQLIMQSQTYSSSSLAGPPSRGPVFGQYQVRPLEAEVLVDAICQLTGTSEKYLSMVPEPFTVVPEGTRAIMLPDGSITSSTLELFGRPSRDTGLESERPVSPTVDQRLYLLNSSHVHEKLERGSGLQRLIGKQPTDDAIEKLYLAVLSRDATAEEAKAARSFVQSGESSRASMVDLAWALINSAEFLYRH
jgi:hypothetical protein